MVVRIFAVLFLILAFVELAMAQDVDGSVVPFEKIGAATVTAVRSVCENTECNDAHAVVFIHGVYGSAETFKNGTFDWPKEIPTNIGSHRVDVYQIEYQSRLLAWLKKDISSLDEVVYAVFNGMRRTVLNKNYRSIALIGHSLGGNVATSYLHTVKTELGHDARSRHSFVLTLGTPTDGADIASIGLYLKSLLGMRDPLLTSLGRDNTFLRMLAHWRYSENAKATSFDCRPVSMYAGLEGAPMYGVQIVSDKTARFMQENFSPFSVTYRKFPQLNHSMIAKPASRGDDLYRWVNDTMGAEFKRVENWQLQSSDSSKLCRSIY